jgi:hypothetical protein
VRDRAHTRAHTYTREHTQRHTNTRARTHTHTHRHRHTHTGTHTPEVTVDEAAGVQHGPHQLPAREGAYHAVARLSVARLSVTLPRRALHVLYPGPVPAADPPLLILDPRPLLPLSPPNRPLPHAVRDHSRVSNVHGAGMVLDGRADGGAGGSGGSGCGEGWEPRTPPPHSPPSSLKLSPTHTHTPPPLPAPRSLSFTGGACTAKVSR